MDSKKSDEYSGQEAQRRFTAALRGAFGTKPTALKDVPRKRPKAKRKRQTKTSA